MATVAEVAACMKAYFWSRRPRGEKIRSRLYTSGESMYRPHSSKVNISQVWVGRVASTRSLGSLEMALTYMIVCARLFEPPFPVTQPPAVSGTNARWQKQTLKIHPLKFYPTCYPTP